MTIKELDEFIYENYYRPIIDIWLLLATKLIKKYLILVKTRNIINLI